VGKQSHFFPQRSGAIPHPLPRPGAAPALALFSTGVRGITKIRTLIFFFVSGATCYNYRAH
jgi:hypothetical protein